MLKHIQVNTHGILSFRENYIDFSPDPFEDTTAVVVAPYWADTDISTGGSTSFRLTTVVEDYLNLQEIIRVAFTDSSNFEMRQLFVATYDQVPANGGFSEIVSEKNLYSYQKEKNCVLCYFPRTTLTKWCW